jgi:SNF2 family DNA or RNA helicase
LPEFGFRIKAELDEDESRIVLKFPFDPRAVRLAKTIHGYHFVPPDKGGPYWRFPKDLTTARLLREKFGEELDLGEKIRAWAKSEVDREKLLTELTTANDAELKNVPEELANFLHPYQRADAKVMAIKNVINSNEPGLGKTVETLSAICERGNMERGSHLVVAPKTSLTPVWEFEIEKWFPDMPVLKVHGEMPKEDRDELIALAEEFHSNGDPFFLIINPAFITYRRDKEQEKVLNSRNNRMEHPLEPPYPEIFTIDWMTIVFDEYHLMGLANTHSQTYLAANDLPLHEDGQKILLSGTPMGGKPIRLWGALHFLEPDAFTAMWRWAYQWLEIEEVDTGAAGMKKKIHGIAKGREEEFNQHLAPHMVRRTKAEVKADLPPKDRHYIACEMTPLQKKQYDAMAADAEIKIEEEHLSAVGILAQYTRLKQFANARHKVRNMGSGQVFVKPTTESGKLPQIMRLLNEQGIFPEKMAEEHGWGDEQIVIGSQFSEFVDLIHEWLNEQGIAAEKITGAVSNKNREELIKQFQANEIRVLVVSTKAAGVAITLDNANTIIITDETWVPDDQEQLEDRVHRISRIHQVTVYYLYSKGTIEEYIHSVTSGKHDTNEIVMDSHRLAYKHLKTAGVVKSIEEHKKAKSSKQKFLEKKAKKVA